MDNNSQGVPKPTLDTTRNNYETQEEYLERLADFINSNNNDDDFVYRADLSCSLHQERNSAFADPKDVKCYYELTLSCLPGHFSKTITIATRIKNEFGPTTEYSCLHIIVK